MKNLDLETLEYVKIAFDIHSDLSTKTNGYKWICRAIDDLKKQKLSEQTTKEETSKENLNIPSVSNSVICPQCKGKGELSCSSVFMRCEKCKGTGKL